MKAWLADGVRTLGALLYWNARKSVYVMLGRRGSCPCHNPSDSGEAGKTGCEAVIGWNRPERFKRRVCPLLVQTGDGVWMCGVAANQVRPFWGRALLASGAAIGLAVGLSGLAVFWGMKRIGYDVRISQVFWPPRWREFRDLRFEMFARQAREYYQAGRLQEAVAAVAMAHSLAPANYEYAMLHAQFLQLVAPESADALYHQLLRTHPEQRNATARIWFRSLLARGRMEEIAGLARQQLKSEPSQLPAWLHAFLFASRARPQSGWLADAARDAALPSSAAAVIELELAVRRATPEQAHALLRNTPLDPVLPYARVHRIDLLLELSFPTEAIGLAANSISALGGRDAARLGMAGRSLAGQRQLLQRDIEAMLSPTRAIGLAEVTLVAQHLIRYPDREFLGVLAKAIERLGPVPDDQRLEAWVNFVCAAGAAADRTQLRWARDKLRGAPWVSEAQLERMEAFFTAAADQQRPEYLLPQLQPFSLDLTYAIWDRYRR